MILVHPTLTEAQIAKTCDVIREVGRAALAKPASGALTWGSAV